MMTVGDRIRITAQIAVLKEIALDYKGEDNRQRYSAVRADISRFKSETIQGLVIWLESQEVKLPRY